MQIYRFGRTQYLVESHTAAVDSDCILVVTMHKTILVATVHLHYYSLYRADILSYECILHCTFKIDYIMIILTYIGKLQCEMQWHRRSRHL